MSTTIITQPVLTEKSTENAKKGVYCFEVAHDANKNQIRKTLEMIYDVVVSDVKTTIRKGKEKRVGRRGVTKMTSARKIAYVTLKKGTIDVFPQA